MPSPTSAQFRVEGPLNGAVDSPLVPAPCPAVDRPGDPGGPGGAVIDRVAVGDGRLIIEGSARTASGGRRAPPSLVDRRRPRHKGTGAQTPTADRGAGRLDRVRWERLILSSGDHSVTVRFHPRLTVVVGVGPLEREGVTSELLGALRGPRPGTNLELVRDDGRRLAVLRPGWGLGDRVLDLESGDDVTERHLTPDGRLDLLAPLGLTMAEARRTMRFTALDVLAPAEEQRVVSGLSSLPQAELWQAADRLVAARATLERVATGIGASIGDTEAIAEVETRHREFERAQDRCDYIRHHGIFTGVACALAGLPAVVLNRWTALPFALLAAAFLVVSVVFRRRMEAARVAEGEALTAAGASSYGGFLHQRIAVLLGTEEARRLEVSDAVAAHRRTQAAWTAMAGDVDVEWALAHQAAVAATAAKAGDRAAIDLAHRLRRAHPGSARELANVVLQRIELLQSVGPSGEQVPLILDEPFEGMDLAATKWLLELLTRMAGHPQLVLLTEDPDIARWAEIEQMAGDVSVVAPTPDRRPAASPVAVAS